MAIGAAEPVLDEGSDTGPPFLRYLCKHSLACSRGPVHEYILIQTPVSPGVDSGLGQGPHFLPKLWLQKQQNYKRNPNKMNDNGRSPHKSIEHTQQFGPEMGSPFRALR